MNNKDGLQAYKNLKNEIESELYESSGDVKKNTLILMQNIELKTANELKEQELEFNKNLELTKIAEELGIGYLTNKICITLIKLHKLSGKELKSNLDIVNDSITCWIDSEPVNSSYLSSNELYLIKTSIKRLMAVCPEFNANIVADNKRENKM